MYNNNTADNVIDVASETTQLDDNNSSTESVRPQRVSRQGRRPRRTTAQAEQTVDAQTASANNMAVATTNETNLFDPLATAWVMKKIAYAEKPLFYMKIWIIQLFVRALGRALNLAEAQHLVQLDGELQKCALEENPDKQIFQPVRFIYQNPTEDLLRFIAECGDLTEVRFKYAGAFYANPQTREVVAISGAPFYYNRKEGRLLFNYDCNLTSMAKAMKLATGHFRFGFCWEDVERLFQSPEEFREKMRNRAKEERSMRKQTRALKAEALVARIFGKRPQEKSTAGNDMASAFADPKPLKKKGAAAKGKTKKD